MCKESLIDFDKYEITKDGKIFSKSWNKHRYLKGAETNGYIQVSLNCKNNGKKLFLLHRVIWYYFNGEIPEGMQVNHIDENKANNALSNLNLMTPKQNTNWGTGIERCHRALLNHPNVSKPIDQIDIKTGEIVGTWKSTMDIERTLGFKHNNISSCCKGGYYQKGKWINMTQAYGYGWKYS